MSEILWSVLEFMLKRYFSSIGPVHELIWRLSGSYAEESPKDLKNQSAENVVFFRSMDQSIEVIHSPTTTSGVKAEILKAEKLKGRVKKSSVVGGRLD